MSISKVTLTFCCAVFVAMAQKAPITVPSLTATVEDTFVRPVGSGNSVTKTVTGQFYRDSQGRTRIERGQLVTLQDPVARTTVVIELTSNTARRFTAPPNPPGASMSTVTNRQSHQDLGTQVISGLPVKGIQFTVTLPPGAVGNLGPLTQTSEIWRSDDLSFTVETKSTDPINGEHTQLFSNIVSGAAVDSALFSIPSGVQVVDIQSPGRSGSQKLH